MNIDFFKEHKKLFVSLLISCILIIVLPLFLYIKFVLLAVLSVILFMKLTRFKLFFKKHKILSVFLIIFYVFITGTSVFLIVKSIQVSTMDFPTERHYVTYMKGIVEPALHFLITASDITQMKSDNMNTIQVYFSPYLPSPFYEIENIFTLGLIKEAKNQGMAVHVAGQGGPSPPPSDTLTNEQINTYTVRALEWAELCEECGVEYFTPLSENDLVLGRNRAVEWNAEILLQVRDVFSGKVLTQWSCWSDDDSADDLNNQTEAYVYRVMASTDFDGVMLDFASPTPFRMKYLFNMSKEKEEGDDYRPCSLEEMVKATSQAAEEIGIPIYVGEFYVETGEAPLGLTGDRLIFNEEEHAEYTTKFLDTVMPYYDGVIHCFWIFPGGGIKNTLAEQVVKEKFGEY